VTVTLEDAGRTVRLSVGERLVVDAGGAWAVARYPRAALELSERRSGTGRHVFKAVAPGRGHLLLVDLSAWPEGRCRPRPEVARRCLLAQAAREGPGRGFPDRPGPGFPQRLGVLGFEIVVAA
jgi:hypothetical protein